MTRLRNNGSGRTPLREMLDRLDGARRNPDGSWKARCPVPGHGRGRGDVNPSLSVKEGEDARVLIHCHTGCSPEAVVAALGMTMAELFPPAPPSPRKKGKPWRGKPTAFYDYQDESRQLLFQVVRYPPRDGEKPFPQRRPDGSGGWIWSLEGVRRVLFRLPELLKADPDEPVYLAEGEKDVLSLVAIEFTATTNPGGANKWLPSYSEALKDRHVVILPDNDEPGRQHAELVARSLAGIAQSIKVVAFPGLPPGGDVTDWIQAGGTREELERLTASTPEWTKSKEAPDSADLTRAGLPRILLGGGPLRETTSDALLALKARNDPPRLFERSERISRIRWDERHRPRIEPLNEHALRGEMDRSGNYGVIRKEIGFVSKHPPLDVVRDLGSLPEWGFPPLEGIVEIPVLRPDGTILDSPGVRRGDLAVLLSCRRPPCDCDPRAPLRGRTDPGQGSGHRGPARLPVPRSLLQSERACPHAHSNPPTDHRRAGSSGPH